MWYLAFLALASGLAIALAAIGSAMGLGKAVSAAMEGTARQPEAAGNIRTTLIIGSAFIEALSIYAFVIALLLMAKLPGVGEGETLQRALDAMKEIMK